MGSGLQSVAQGRDSTLRSLLEVLLFAFDNTYVSARGLLMWVQFQWRPEEGNRCPGTGGSGESPEVKAGNELRSSYRAVPALSH